MLDPTTLQITIHPGSPLPGGGTCEAPLLWLLAVPLKNLPRHETLKVEIGDAHTTVRLP
jgi:hypothetical protein